MLLEITKNVSDIVFRHSTGGLQAATHQSQPPIQLLQQIVTPNGEIQHMPVSLYLKMSHIFSTPSDTPNRSRQSKYFFLFFHR